MHSFFIIPKIALYLRQSGELSKKILMILTDLLKDESTKSKEKFIKNSGNFGNFFCEKEGNSKNVSKTIECYH
ncbi:hypothetical protein PAESOLCIP111_03455 [Paenibacillus solanacearum]|uniref:Uncharacterized protein n=1 Tax=Paenibacillus solanacearum TaxID=2048548 RepID=A0A916K2V4_9BACL|nr:hypothetical protein PAESOLCIP111_03455 [Paenibacillus solanacearum]